MRHNLLLNIASVSCLVGLAMVFGAYLFSRGLWRAPLTWLCLALTGMILYGVTCPYARLNQAHHLVQTLGARLPASLRVGHHRSATSANWSLQQMTTVQMQKDGHIVFFALLPIGLGLLVRQRNRPGEGRPRPWWRPRAAYVGVFAGLVLFATAVEMLQSVTNEREPKVADWLLNLKGLALGALLLCLLLGLFRIRRRLASRHPRPGPSPSAVPDLGHTQILKD